MRLGRWKSLTTACRQIKIDVGRTVRPAGLAASLALAASNPALANEGGVSFWLPGEFGSLAAARGGGKRSWILPASPYWRQGQNNSNRSGLRVIEAPRRRGSSSKHLCSSQTRRCLAEFP